MMKTKVVRDGVGYDYIISETGEYCRFEYCSIGKYEGKSFLKTLNVEKTENGYDSISINELFEVNIIESSEITTMFGKKVTIPEVVEYDETKPLNYTDVFFNTARETYFGGDWSDGNSWKGFTYNRYWNGWECPYFDKKTCYDILTYSNGEKVRKYGRNVWYCECDDSAIWYSKKDDCFYYRYEGEVSTIATAHIVNGQKVYDLGAGWWCWDEITTIKETA